MNLSPDDLLRKALIGALFRGGKVRLAELGARFGLDAEARFRQELDALEPMQAMGLVRLSPGMIEVTGRGQYFLRNIAVTFDAYHGRSPGTAPRFSRTV
jgi:oxygen-independent coproporphyrinogen-3 oxidase